MTAYRVFSGNHDFLAACFKAVLIVSLILGVFLTNTAQGSSPQSVYQIPTDGEFRVNLAPLTDIYSSNSGRLGFEDFRSNGHLFHPNANQHIDFGFGEKTSWLRITLNNTSSETKNLWLEFTNPLLSNVTLYPQDSRQQASSAQEAASPDHRITHFPITIPANSQSTLYLEINAGPELGSNLYLSSTNAYQTHRQLQDMAAGFFYGALLATGLYFLALYSRRRNTNYLFGSLLAFATTAHLLVTDGVLKLASHQYPDLVAIGFPVSFGALLVAQLLFAKSYLNLKPAFPSLNGLMIGAIAAVTIAFIVLTQNYPANSDLCLLIGTNVAVVILCASALVIGSGYRPAIFFLAGFICHSLGMALIALDTPDFTGLALGYDVFKFTLCIQFIFYALGLRQINNFSDRQVAHQKTREEAHEKWQQLADASFEAILIFKGSTIIEANSSCEELLGYSPEDLVNSKGEQFIESKDYSLALSRIQKASERPFETQIKTKDGTSITAEIRCKQGTYGDDPVTITAIRDISERKKYETELRKLGYYDSLTGLANRLLFRERLEHAIGSTARVKKQHALLFVDLDQFKNVNDSLGHDIGDELLVQVGRRLSNNTRRENTVARLGGDEFAILLEDIHAPYVAAKVAEQLLLELGKTVQIQGLNLAVTPSIGIAMYPQDGETISDLLKSADTAMYHAKDQGRNNYQFFTSDQNKRIVERIELESELRDAVDNDEFYLLYQPKLDIHTGEITGIEALARWKSPTRGILNPKQFIHVAEETSLIRPIGEVILNKACLQAKLWLDGGLRFPISVNLSSSQFNQEDLVHKISQTLEKTNLPAELLELEITEGAVTSDADRAIAIMRELKQLGIGLAIDDFGAGYSSLGQLKRFPADALKIERAFIRDIESNPEDLSITSTIINLAHSLNMKVVAEGVENSRQLEILKSLSCDELQGYLYTHPIAANEIEEMMTRKVNLYSIDKKVS